MSNNNIYKITLFNINDAFPAGERFQEPALGLGYIKSYFDTYSHFKDKIDIKILKHNIWDNLTKEKPDLIGISSVTQDYTNAIRYARKIRDAGSKALIIIGGIHISNLPESFNSVFDIAVLGEGEETFKELIESIYEFGFAKERLNSIKGLLYEDKGGLVKTGGRGLIDDLDAIPPPYRKYLKESTFLHILTARGCPFRCAYCSSTAFWGFKVRFHSAQRVAAEMLDLIKNCNLKHISIWDDLFSINKQRLQEILQIMKDNKRFFKNVTFGVTARPNVVDTELCELLTQMNVTRVSLGIESGSDRMLKLLNRGLTVEQNYRAIKILKKYNFIVSGGFILGSPDETIEDLNQTYCFISNAELDIGGIYLALPYPNTAFWDYADKKKLVSVGMDFSRFVLVTDPTVLKVEDNFMLLSDKMTKDEFIPLANKIYQLFAKKNAFSLFQVKTFNLRNILIVMTHPLKFSPFIFTTFKRILRTIFRYG